jgi:hypothetical protein
MSNKLQSKLKNSQDLRAIQELLSHVNGIEIIEYNVQGKDFSGVEESFKEIRRISSVPNSNISVEIDIETFANWVKL